MIPTNDSEKVPATGSFASFFGRHDFDKLPMFL
jgi:hypothetical protein